MTGSNGPCASPPADRAEAWTRMTTAVGPVAALAVEGPEHGITGREAVEVVAVRFDGGNDLRAFRARVQARTPPPSRVVVSHAKAGPAAGPPAGDPGDRVAVDLGRWLQGATVVGFDLSEIGASVAWGLPASGRSNGGVPLDVKEIACILRPELSAELPSLLRETVGTEGRAGAVGRATDVLEVLVALFAEIQDGEHDELLDVLDARPEAWGWRPFFERGDDGRFGPLSRAARRRPRTRERPSDPPDPLGRRPSPIESRSPGAILRDEARVRRELPGYRLREEQVELADAIAAAFDGERVLAVEAGTGIGKTLGYALVSFLHASATGERVVISSANRTLQERVVQEELPAIARVLGMPPLRAIVLKGRGNYGSPSRARDVALGTLDSGLEDLSLPARLYVASYFARCPRQDLQHFGGWLAEREPALRLVRERIACSGDCNPRMCRGEPGGACGYLSRVDELAGASVVSINHSLLLSWPARYGPIDRLIVDEAHELVAEGDRAFAETLSAGDLRAALRRIRTHPKRGGIGILAARAGRRDILEEVDERVVAAEKAIDELGARLTVVTDAQAVRVPPETLVPPEGPWAEAMLAAETLGTVLGRLAGLIDVVAPPTASDDDAGVEGDPRADAIHREAASVGRFLANAAGGMLRDLFQQSREDHVYAARARRRADATSDWSLTVTPLDAAELLHARVLDSPRTVVMLSATLGVGGDPGPTLEKVGWDRLPRERRMAPLVLPSPFDFSRNAVLAWVRGRSYREHRFDADCARATATVARLLGGRTMALFTSRRRMQAVARLLSEMLRDDGPGIPLLVQPQSGGAAPLVDRFVRSPRAVLLGTRSLWQGVDIPGDALSCVVIDKLPFPQPTDPLFRGRQARLRALGEDAFTSLSLEPAVVLFKQMFGRLVRSETDRGFVVVLGADLTKGYIRSFVRSLPGPPRVLADEFDVIVDEMRAFFDLKADGDAP